MSDTSITVIYHCDRLYCISNDFKVKIWFSYLTVYNKSTIRTSHFCIEFFNITVPTQNC